MSHLSLSEMNARVTLWLCTSFFITLNLLLTGGGALTENACTRTADLTTIVKMNQPSALLLCRSGQYVWRKGSDLCDLEGFTRFNSCNGYPCTVNRSEYINEPATYFCCGSEETVDQFCYNITINPIVKVTVPPLLRAGREETVFVIVTAKPRPSVFPELTIIIPDSNDSTNGTSDTILTASLMVATRSEEPLKYFVFYTIELPWIEQESAHAVLNIAVPWNDYNHSVSDSLTYPMINIIPASPPMETITTTVMAETTTDSEAYNTSAPKAGTLITTYTEDDGSSRSRTDGVQSACMGNGDVIGAAVGTGIAAAILSFIATVVVVFLFKQRSKKKDKSHRFTPKDLPFDKSIMNGTTIIEPTPTIDNVGLIASESGRGMATSPLVSSEPGFTRLSSRGSNSPTTPMTEFDPLISHRHSGVIVHNEPSAAAAASGPKFPHVPGMGMGKCVSSHGGSNFERHPVEGEKDSDDPHHVYSEIKNVIHCLPPSKRPLPHPPPFLCLEGKPAPCSGNQQTLTTQNFVNSQPTSDGDVRDSTYSREGNKIKLETDLQSPESEV